jgi:hypothetical protein
VRDLRRRLDEALEAVASRSPASGPIIDTDTLATAVEAAIRRHDVARYSTTSIDALENLSYAVGQTDPVRACELMELVVARPDLPADRRIAAETGLAAYQRAACNFDAAERTLRAVIDRVGLTSVDGHDIGQQLVNTLAEAKRPREALQLAETLLQHAGGSPDQLPYARQVVAEMAAQTGDVNRARSEFTALLRDYAGEARLANARDNWRSRLRSLQ